MDETFGFDDLFNLVKEGEGLYGQYVGEPDAGQTPEPARQQDGGAPAAVQRPETSASGGLGQYLIPGLVALVVGWLAYKGTGRPMTGLLAAILAGLAWWFFMGGKKNGASTAAASAA